jgi:uncharacterized MnhB-related membrane protein
MTERTIPLAPIVLSAFAVALIGAGVCGLVQPALVPPLARPAVAWSLIAVGAMLDTWAMLAIVQAARRARR